MSTTEAAVATLAGLHAELAEIQGHDLTDPGAIAELYEREADLWKAVVGATIDDQEIRHDVARLLIYAGIGAQRAAQDQARELRRQTSGLPA